MHRDGPRPSRSRGTDQAFARTYLFFHERRSRGDNAGRMEGVGEEGGGGEERRTRVALAPRARWISIMLNRKWSPAIECLSAPPLEAHKAGGIRLLRCNVTEKLNSLVLSATAFSRPIVRFLPFPSLSPPLPSLLFLVAAAACPTTTPFGDTSSENNRSWSLSKPMLSFPFFGKAATRQNKNKLEQK